jgi:hypothetical protein
VAAASPADAPFPTLLVKCKRESDMSLWQKRLGQISFLDADGFLKAKIPEGHRLDYKLHFPNDLAKTIAAFGNTLGGMIILGVDSDKVSNEPIWPPVEGMPNNPGIADRIIQVATEAIYPPVRVSVSQMENEALPGHQIAVVFVDESRDAPHAVEKRRKVYVYERTDNKTDPHVLADIDRIRYLLDRRNAIEEKRELLMSKGLAKLKKELENGLSPKCWVSVVPVYPWRELCRPSECYQFLQDFANSLGSPRNTIRDVVRVPDGALMRIQSRFGNGTARPTDAALVTTDGIAIIMRTAFSLDRRHNHGVGVVEYEHSEKMFDMPGLWERIAGLFKCARDFYGRSSVEAPGLLSLDLGLEGVMGFRLVDRNNQGSPYSEDEYRDSATVPADIFFGPDGGLETLRKRLIFGFDYDTPEGL